jgi:amidophosphoribosyltransferase
VSAYAVSKHLKKPYCQGFIKNRYIFRTFIMPSQRARQRGVRAKLNAIPLEFQGKNVLLVDDSIVRGTTSREIVSMAREAGARKVYFSSCAPPITHAHIYGIDLASTNELVAHDRTAQDIADLIGADAVIYQDLPDLVSACAHDSPRGAVDQKFEVGVFCGKYVTPVGEDYFKHLERVRGETRKMKVMENAVQAVANGSASTEELRMAAHGVEVDDHGEVVARDSGSDGEGRLPVKEQVDRLSSGNTFGDPARPNGTNGQFGDSQDIALYNLNND